MQIERHCLWCGKEFTADKRNIVTCSKACALSRQREQCRVHREAKREFRNADERNKRHTDQDKLKNKCHICGKRQQRDYSMGYIAIRPQICDECVVATVKECIRKGAKIPGRSLSLLYSRGYGLKELKAEMKENGEIE